ncbi:MAG: DNA repair protein RecO [Pseudomonadota bacterium]
MRSARRVQLQPAYLLHHRPWRDSSRVGERHVREHGRFRQFAKCARRANHACAPVLQPFLPLLVSWSGAGDGGTLTGAELDGAPVALPPARLMSGFYLNELQLKLLPRQDPHPGIYDAYADALGGLRAADAEARTLRLFEKRRLDALGYGIDYAHVAESGEPVEPAAYYHVGPERGVLGVADDPGSPYAYRGADLLSLAAEELHEPSGIAAARRLLHGQLETPLERRELGTRPVARAVRSTGVGRTNRGDGERSQ